MQRIAMVLILCGIAGLVSSAQAEAAKVYLLAIADVEDNEVGAALEANVDMVRTLFRHAVPSDTLVYRELTDKRLTGDNLFIAIEKCPVSEDDCLIVWYSGRGRDRDGEKFLELTDATVIRAGLVEAIQSTRARVKVLVTDRCQVMLKSNSPRFAADVPPSRTIARGFGQLLLKEEGFFEFDSTHTNSAGTYLSNGGGLLTLALAYPPKTHLRQSEPGGKRDRVQIVSGGSLTLRAGTLWDTLDDDRSEWNFVRDQSQAMLGKYVRDVGQGGGENLSDRTKEPISEAAESPSADLVPGEDLPEVISVNTDDVLVSLDGKPLASPNALARSAQPAGKVSLVFASNSTGLLYECRVDMSRQKLSAISVEALPGLGLRVTSIEDPETLLDMQPVAARPLVRQDVPFGIGGKFINISSHPAALPEKQYGLLVESVRTNSPAAKAGLKQGDILLTIENLYFSNSQGYRFALKTSPLLTNIVYIDAASRDVTRGQTFYPHKVVEHLGEPPEGCEYLSITLTEDLIEDE